MQKLYQNPERFKLQQNVYVQMARNSACTLP